MTAIRLTDLAGNPVWVNPDAVAMVLSSPIKDELGTEVRTLDGKAQRVREKPDEVAKALNA